MKKMILMIGLLSIASMCFGQLTTKQHLKQVLQHYNDYIEPDLQELDPLGPPTSRLLYIHEYHNLLDSSNLFAYSYEDERHLWSDESYLVVNSITLLYKKTRVFNSDRQIERINKYELEELFPVEQLDYIYDDLGKIEKITTCIPENNGCTPFEQLEFKYNVGIYTTSSDYSLNETTGLWDLFEATFNFEIGNKLLPKLIVSSDSTTTEKLTEFDYVFEDGTDLIEQITLSVFNDSLEVMVPKIQLAITNDDNLITIEAFRYNEMNDTWILFENFEKFFNSNGQQTLEYFYTVSENGTTERWRTDTYSYETTVDIKDILATDYKIICANPITDGQLLTVNGSQRSENLTLSIHDTYGQLISQQTVVPNQAVQWPSNMPNGMYLLNLTSNAQSILSKKIIKQ